MSTDLASIEEPLLQLRRQIQELAEAGEDTSPLEGELGRLTRDAYAKLSPWQTTDASISLLSTWKPCQIGFSRRCCP